VTTDVDSAVVRKSAEIQSLLETCYICIIDCEYYGCWLLCRIWATFLKPC